MNNETKNHDDFELKCVILKDKREIHINDEGAELYLSMVSDGETIFTLPMSNYPGGYGNGSLYLSPSNSYLLFACSSGQSDETFTLCKITDKLEVIYESPHFIETTASYSFSDDEESVIQGLQVWGEWWWSWLDREMEEDENGAPYFHFGQINLFNIEKKEVSRHIIRIYPSQDWRPKDEEYCDSYMAPKMTSDDSLKITMPWGMEELSLPLEDIVVFAV